MATGGVDPGLSEESFDVNCTVCITKQRIKQARNYCHDCKKNLCADCTDVHNDFLGDHTVVEGHGHDNMDTLLTEKCGKHEDRLIELYCTDHDVVACSVCGLLEHRSCAELKHVTECVDELTTIPNLQQVPDQLKSALETVDNVISSLDHHIEQLGQNEGDVLEEIEALTKRILAKVEAMKEKTMKDVKARHRELVTSSTESREIGTTMKKEIQKSIEGLDAPATRRAHLFVVKKKGGTVAKRINKLCDNSNRMIRSSKLVFKPDLRIEDCLKGYQSLGRVTESEKYTCSLMKRLDVKVPGDSEECDIYGCCILSNRTVLITDNKNKKLKRIDPSTNTVAEYVKTEDVWGIACISQQDVAVRSGMKCVKLFTIGQNISYSRSINMEEKCFELAYSDGSLCSGAVKQINVYNLNGTMLKTIPKNASGTEMFSYINDVAIFKALGRIYIVDRDNGLICTDLTGQKVFSLSCSDLGLDHPKGMTTDQRGNVFVCGYKSQNVVQVTKDGSLLGMILTAADGLVEPKCMCFDTTRNRLYIGGNTSELLVFELS